MIVNLGPITYDGQSGSNHYGLSTLIFYARNSNKSNSKLPNPFIHFLDQNAYYLAFLNIT